MSRAWRLGIVVCAASLVGSGCLFGEVEGIPCAADAECPTGYFCDLPRDTCQQEGEGVGAPLLEIQKVRDLEGNVVRTPSIPPCVTSTLGFIVDNTGEGPAEALDLTFAELACIASRPVPSTVPGVIEAGRQAEISVEMTPGEAIDCAGLKIVDWFLTYSGRETRGTIDVNILSE